MRHRFAIIAAVSCVAVVAGCRVDPYAEVREREWRRLEEEIYYRDGMIAELEDQLDSCRRENDALRRRGATTEPGELLPTPRSDAVDDSPPEDIQEFEPPKTDLGNEAPPPLGRVAPPRRTRVLLAANHGASRADGVLAPVPSADDSSTANADDACGPATSLSLNRRLTGGNNIDGRFGDEGIFALVEARDAAGRLIADPGAMTLVLHDPMAAGDRSVVAQWDFTAHEVASRFRAGAFGSGTHFELPWPNRPPRRSQLRLEVRLATRDGKTLSTSRKFTVDLPSASSAAASSERVSGPGAVARETGPAELPPWRPTRD